MLVVAFCGLVLATQIPASEPANAGASSTPTSPSAGMARLADGAAKARARYLEGDFVGAVAVVDALDAVFAGVPAGCADTPEPCTAAGLAFAVNDAAWNAWGDAQATKALALSRRDDDAGSDAVFRGLLIVRPAFSPDRGFIPPKLIARFEGLQQAALAGATVPVTVTLDGPGQPVVDGRSVVVGGTVDLAPGRHFIGVDGRGRAVAVGAAATVLAGRTAVRTATTTPIGAPPERAPPAVGEDGPPWLLVGAGAAGLVAVVGVAVGVVVALQPTNVVDNPGGTTVFVDASKFASPAGTP